MREAHAFRARLLLAQGLAHPGGSGRPLLLARPAAAGVQLAAQQRRARARGLRRARPGEAAALQQQRHDLPLRGERAELTMDWGEIFGISVSPWELIIRGSAMYLFLYLLFRVVIRRRVGSIGMADILILVIVADASQNGMSGEYRS